jgi:hypothetical protein
MKTILTREQVFMVPAFFCDSHREMKLDASSRVDDKYQIRQSNENSQILLRMISDRCVCSFDDVVCPFGY